MTNQPGLKSCNCSFNAKNTAYICDFIKTADHSEFHKLAIIGQVVSFSHVEENKHILATLRHHHHDVWHVALMRAIVCRGSIFQHVSSHFKGLSCRHSLTRGLQSFQWGEGVSNTAVGVWSVCFQRERAQIFSPCWTNGRSRVALANRVSGGGHRARIKKTRCRSW